ncbi:unnamed protein product, partial [Rotaria socialis]
YEIRGLIQLIEHSLLDSITSSNTSYSLSLSYIATNCLATNRPCDELSKRRIVRRRIVSRRIDLVPIDFSSCLSSLALQYEIISANEGEA